MELNELKIQKKKTMPSFIQRRAKQIKKVPLKWRRPTGKQNKVRLGKGGKMSSVKVGYGTPSSLRHMTKDMKVIVVVSNKDELLALTKDQTAVISNVGNKRRLELLKLAKEKSIAVYNIKKIDDAIKTIEESMKQRKDSRKSKKSRLKNTKTEKKEEKKAEAKTEKKEEAKEQTEKTKEEQRKEVEKILIHEK